MTAHAFVLLHGFTGHSTSWDLVASMLPRDGRVFRPALYGHDPSLRDAPVQSFDDEVDRLADAVRAEALEGARLCGYSMGGRVALGMLARHPELFSSAVLIGAHPGLTREAARAERVAADERWARLLEERGVAAFVDEWEELPLFRSQRRLPDAVRAAHRARRLAHDPRELARGLRVLGLGRMPCRVEALAGIDIPVRLVAGELDRKFVELARAAARRLPRAEVRLVRGAGHDVVLERPRELVRALVDPVDVEGARER